jgi:cystathionine beta-lyase family protein involved in aluminum resistance
MIDALLARFDVPAEVADAARRAYAQTHANDPRATIDADVRANVLRAFYDEGLAEHDLHGTLGYGYDDAVRTAYESLLSRIFGTERTLARLSFVSGTHAIVSALDACLPHAGTLVSATGRPYDTLRNAIVDAPYSLVARGATYREAALAPDGTPDPEAIARACDGADVVFVQRSRGYASRQSLSAIACGEIARVAKAVAPHAFVLVDNCYGELVDATEPTHHGVDAVMGSLIKNLGGGLAPAGGYVAGSADVVERVAARHTAPGIAAGVGSSLGFGRTLVQGLFYAPLVVAEACAGLDFTAALFTELGVAVDPLPGALRHDIVQSLALGTPARVLAFARGLQRAMPIDAGFAPEPGAVPGYTDAVVMSGGAFIPGATIELSFDAPLRQPYETCIQGGTTRAHTMLGSLLAAAALTK